MIGLNDAEGWTLGLYIIGWALALTTAIYWLFVPFAIFGIKPLLRELIAEQRKTNELLAKREAP